MTPQILAAIARQRATIRKEWQAVHTANSNRRPGPARCFPVPKWDAEGVGLMLAWRKAERQDALLTLDEAKGRYAVWIDARQPQAILCPSEPA